MWNKINQKEKKEKSLIFRQRRENAIKRRDQIYKDKIKHNIYYMNRWNIVKEKRKDIEHMQREHEKKHLFVFWWVRQIQIHNVLQSMYDVFDETRMEYYQNIRKTL
mgnify:CR=1 FL=1